MKVSPHSGGHNKNNTWTRGKKCIYRYVCAKVMTFWLKDSIAFYVSKSCWWRFLFCTVDTCSTRIHSTHIPPHPHHPCSGGPHSVEIVFFCCYFSLSSTLVCILANSCFYFDSVFFSLHMPYVWLKNDNNVFVSNLFSNRIFFVPTKHIFFCCCLCLF